jgi:hypothetical protein
VIILLLCITTSIHGQSVRFSKFYDHNTGSGIILNIIPDDDDFLGQGINFKNGVMQSHTVHIDTEGNVLNQHAVFDVNVGYESYGMIRLGNGQVVSAGSLCDYNMESPEYCDYYFARLDETGDTLFTKVYERQDTCDLVLDMVQTRPNKIMLIGWTCNDTTQDNTELMFITVDTLGNEVNRVVWGGGGTDFVSAGVVVGEHGDVVMAGYTKSFPSNNSGRTWVVRTDSIGNVKWHRTYSGVVSTGSSAARLCMLPDGNLLVAGGNSTFGSGVFDGDGFLLKIDTAGTQLWAKEYEVMGGQGLWGVVGLEDGTIVSCGVTDDGAGGSQAGWLIKTDENGDTLWTRTYDSSDLIDYLRNMLVLPNGDIVMVGHGRAPGQTNQDGWILRVDSMGCLVEGCGAVGIEEQLVIGNEQFSIWPNPAENVLNIVSQMKMETVQLYDMQGRLVYRSAVGHLQEYGVDVSSLGVGMYVLEVRSTEGIQSVRKVMIQRP